MNVKNIRPKTYVKEIYDNNNVLRYKSRYIKSTNSLIKDVFFHRDGKTVASITKYDSQTGKPLREVFFNAIGKYFSSIDYDKINY